jgi:hypothetical protein
MTNLRFTPARFDQASNDWKANKIRVGQMYYYKCEGHLKSGESCSKKASSHEKYRFLSKHYCAQHGETALRLEAKNIGASSN